MVKKKSEAAEAKLSKLPVDLSGAPMVIDLPDGQKIILNRLQEGAVIEVATWHGTGRPDSRTNRFMLGMTTGQPGASSEKPELSTNSTSEDSAGTSSNSGRVRFLMKSAKSLILTWGQPLKAALQKSKELSPVDSTTDLEINAWLESLKSEAASKAAGGATQAKKKVVKNASVKRKR
jgi:hypothetical protein